MLIPANLRCAPVNGLAGCYVSTIGKPHEYFNLSGAHDHFAVGEHLLFLSRPVPKLGPLEIADKSAA